MEYSLLLAFIIFTVIGLAVGMKGSIRGIVSMSNAEISTANSMAS